MYVLCFVLGMFAGAGLLVAISLVHINGGKNADF